MACYNNYSGVHILFGVRYQIEGDSALRTLGVWLKIAVIVAVTVLTITSVASAQNSTLRRHYGNAIGEVYRTPNRLIVTAFFDAHGDICREQIESEIRGRRMTDKDVNRVLDEIAPKNYRGNYKIGGFRNMSSPDNDSSGVFEDYERLTITKIGSDNEYRYVFILYHSAECAQLDADKD